MNWLLERRDEGWFVIAADGSSEVFHPSRADAIKHQKAMYARDARVASMYADLDAQTMEELTYPVENVEPTPMVANAVSMSALSPLAAELVGLLLKDERESSLVASVAQSHSLFAQQMHEAQQERQALVAALGRMGSPVINIPATEVNVPPAEITVNVPPAEVTVNVPDVHVQVEAPQVTVRPEIVVPERSKTVTFERDPLTQQVTRAEVTEG